MTYSQSSFTNHTVQAWDITDLSSTDPDLFRDGTQC